MNWNDAVQAAENKPCDECTNPEACAAEGACIDYLDQEGEHDQA